MMMSKMYRPCRDLFHEQDPSPRSLRAWWRNDRAPRPLGIPACDRSLAASLSLSTMMLIPARRIASDALGVIEQAAPQTLAAVFFKDRERH